MFDAFIAKSRLEIGNFQLAGNLEQYYEKIKQAVNLHEIAERITIDFHDNSRSNLKSAFQIRSAYRTEADFSIDHIQTKFQAQEGPRLERIIDIDAAVSENYQYLTSKGLEDLYSAAKPETTFERYRKEALGDLHTAMRKLFPDPELLLQDFGSMQSGSFRFRKGAAEDFHYKNLSSGEKATFDILLDVFVKRHITPDAIFCIDEPELHVSTALQGMLLSAVLSLLPENAQLWIATHSIGVVKEASLIYEKNPNDVSFLSFFNCDDLDGSIELKSCSPNRSLWREVYQVALDDLSLLTAPKQVVFCEGKEKDPKTGFDAKCYNRLFADEHDDTLFISRGSANEVARQTPIKKVLESVVAGIKIIALIDNDDTPDQKRREDITPNRQLEIGKNRKILVKIEY